MKTPFGTLPGGENISLYTISCGGITAKVTDLGASLVSLLVPDSTGTTADVVLGYDDAAGYLAGSAFLGATVGRNANRVKGAGFLMGSDRVCLTANENGNNLHSGPDNYNVRRWDTVCCTGDAVTFHLFSPSGDQGFPGNAHIYVTYTVTPQKELCIRYEATADQDTVFNLTNHSYFNLAGHQHPELAMGHILTIPGRHFCPDDAQNIPTGELRPVAGTPMDFRAPKVIGQDIEEDYEPLHLQGGYDHNWEVFCNPCAILYDPTSGRRMTVTTDCPGIQLYAGNFLDEKGKGGTIYGKRSGIALETQYYPDSVNHPEWTQPFTKAGETYRSETIYSFEF